jgi:hypothetical protein
MKYKNFILFIVLSIGTSCYGSDTTLYHKRVGKIKALAQWLNERPNFKLNSIADTSLKSWETYDTAINLFFDKAFLNSQFNLKTAVYTFDYILPLFPLDSFVLKIPKVLSDTLIDEGDYTSYTKNTLIFYLPMYGKEFEGFYFEFKNNSDKLIYLIEAGGSNEEYKKKKKFLNNIQGSR